MLKPEANNDVNVLAKRGRSCDSEFRTISNLFSINWPQLHQSTVASEVEPFLVFNTELSEANKTGCQSIGFFVFLIVQEYPRVHFGFLGVPVSTLEAEIHLAPPSPFVAVSP